MKTLLATRRGGRMVSRPAVLLLLCFGAAWPTKGSAQELTMRWVFPVETVFISDFDPLGSGRQPDLFQIQILDGAAADQDVVLRVSATMERPQRTFVFRGETQPFRIEELVVRLTNRDLASRGRPHSLRSFEVGETGELQDQLLRTGRFPAGTYVFRAELLTPQGILLADAEVSHDVTNPTRIELVGPGRPFGDPPPTLGSPSPRFLWSTDSGLVAGAGEYRIRVVPVADAASGEEAIDQFAVWESDAVIGTSAIYPGSTEAMPLRPGATYAWQVVREVRTSAGIERLESPIYWFRMASGVVERGPGVDEPLDRQLRQVLLALGLIPELDGFRQQGRIVVDGRPVPPEALADLLRGIISGDVEVSSVMVR